MSLDGAKLVADVLLKESHRLHGRIVEAERGVLKGESPQGLVASLRETSIRAAGLYATAELLVNDLNKRAVILAKLRADTLDECVELLQRCGLPEAALAIQLHKLKGAPDAKTT